MGAAGTTDKARYIGQEVGGAVVRRKQQFALLCVVVAPLSLAVVRIAVGLKIDGGDFKFMAAVVGVQLYCGSVRDEVLLSKFLFACT